MYVPMCRETQQQVATMKGWERWSFNALNVVVAVTGLAPTRSRSPIST